MFFFTSGQSQDNQESSTSLFASIEGRDILEDAHEMYAMLQSTAEDAMVSM